MKQGINVFDGIDRYLPVEKPVVTIGTFDGVHLGHRKIFEELTETAKSLKGESLVITFWPHPRHVIKNDEDSLKLLNTLDEKIEMLEKLGIRNLLILPFTSGFSKQNPEDFIREILIRKLNIAAIVIGYDHRFGVNRTGSYDYLLEQAGYYGYDLIQVPALEIDGISVSSTKIRNALMEGDLETANKMLGYPYFIEGFVEQGMHIGKGLGFPTANINHEDDLKLLPSDGVYVTGIKIGNKEYFGMLNNGENPSIKGKGRTLEVHILNFKGDIYEKTIRVSFLKKLRDEKKFKTLEQLAEQITIDKTNTISYLKSIGIAV